jgi:hypothetical protein
MGRRGEGLIYVGSQRAVYGWEVVELHDCSCMDCVWLPAGDVRQRVSASVECNRSIRVLRHARMESFVPWRPGLL